MLAGGVGPDGSVVGGQFAAFLARHLIRYLDSAHYFLPRSVFLSALFFWQGLISPKTPASPLTGLRPDTVNMLNLRAGFPHGHFGK